MSSRPEENAEGSPKTSERGDEQARARALAKAVRSIEEAIEALEASIHREFGDLEQRLRQNMFDAASGVVEAVWHAQRGGERVDAALPLVLISQIQRSGGTLLSQLLDRHPEVLAFPHELKWGGDLKYRWPKIDPSTAGPLHTAFNLVAGQLAHLRASNLFGYAKGTSAGPSNQGPPFQWSQWAYVEAFLEAWEAKPPHSRRQCFDTFFSAYFSAFLGWRWRSEPKKVITAFTPRVNFFRSYPGNEAFFDDYPDGRMISICRHPTDWYASASRHNPKNAGSKYESIHDSMPLWRESVDSSLQLKTRYPDQVLLVAFTSLISDTTRTMRRIADRLDLTWDRTLTVPTFNGMPIASNSSFDPVMGIDASAIGRGHLLPAAIRARIEADNVPIYERFLAATDV